ncbi:MAG: hypothetical protein JXQ74_02105 [Alphaproteobacteria bacterium]|nr:hypothetical protein [Alphaproteobacteria bacterium]
MTIKLPEKLIINGGKPVSGVVEISGAKNAVLGLMAATVLTDELVTLRNVPHITDVIDMCDMLRELGAEVAYQPEERILEVHAHKIKTNRIPRETAKKIRASYYLWGALLARFSITKEFDSLIVPVPGGCKWGKKGRGHDFHEELLKLNLGVSIEYTGDLDMVFKLPKEMPCSDHPRVYTTPRPSHGATMHWLLSTVGSHNAMMYGASQEPEIFDLMDMLSMMAYGQACFIGQGETGLIKRQGACPVGLLGGVDYIIMPDRLEAAAYAMLAVATRGRITLKGIDTYTMSPFLTQLRDVLPDGVLTTVEGDTLHIAANDLDFKHMQPQTMLMSPFPGMETDLHQIWAAVLARANGKSYIVDPVWSTRTVHVPGLQKMGVKIEAQEETYQVSATEKRDVAIIEIEGDPSENFHGATVNGPDLRGTMGLIVMACSVKGESVIDPPAFALRGHPNLIANLKRLGVDVKEG